MKFIDEKNMNQALTRVAKEIIQEKNEIDNMILIQEEQPTSSDNKLWVVDNDEETVLVPTGEEFSELNSALNDIKVVDISDLKNRMSTAENGKVSKPTTSPNGTSGQLLRTNGDGTTTWVDQGLPTDAQTAEAVSSWLNNHPEATTTVQDGSITRQKLNSDVLNDLNQVADSVGGITVNNTYGKNNVLPFDSLPNGTVKGVTITKDGNSLVLNGTATGTDSITGPGLMLIQGQKYTVRCYTTSTKKVNASIRYRDLANSEKTIISFGSTLNTPVTFTVPAEYSSIYVKFGCVSGVTYADDTYKVSISLGELNETYVEYGNELSAYDGYSRHLINDLTEDMLKRDTYVTPEMFGAAGNGNRDDTVALQSCIEYAIANNVPIYGAKSYRVYQEIVIDADDLIVYIHDLYSNSNLGNLVKIIGSRNSISFDKIRATGNATVGLAVASTPSRNTLNNIFKIGYISSGGHSIYLYGDSTEGTPYYNSYSTFILNKVSSNYGNAIHFGSYATEHQFYNAQVECPNGWAIWKPGSARCFGFSLERNTLNGIYLGPNNNGAFFGFRYTEMIDKLIRRMNGDQSQLGGTLIKFTGPYNGSIIFVSDGYIPYQAIDTSECTDYTDPSIDVDPPETWYPKWIRFNSATKGAYIHGTVKYGQYGTQNGGARLGDKMIVVNGKKICSPVMESIYTVTKANLDMRDNYENNLNNYPYATHFIIDVADCIVHLASSYCCMGYNHIVVDQSDASKLCTIYNSYNDETPIFNGQTLGPGIYDLKCMCDLSLTEEQIPETYNYYTGRNDRWIVTKRL